MLVTTFESFCTAVHDYARQDAPANWRAGQTAFVLLCRIRPELAEMIRGSDFDPLHDDSNLLAFYSYVGRHWDWDM